MSDFSYIINDFELVDPPLFGYLIHGWANIIDSVPQELLTGFLILLTGEQNSKASTNPSFLKIDGIFHGSIIPMRIYKQRNKQTKKENTTKLKILLVPGEHRRQQKILHCKVTWHL